MEVLDEDSFEKLFRSFFPPLMAFAKKMLVDEDDAREVVHMVFISSLGENERKLISRHPSNPTSLPRYTTAV